MELGFHIMEVFTPEKGPPMTGTQAVDRAAGLLALVLDADEPVGFAQLADLAGLPGSTTSRLLGALERNGLVRREPSGEFAAGPVFSRYAARHDPDAELARLATPVLESVAERTGETVHLAVPRGREALQVLQVDTRYLLGARDWSTVEVPPHCSAQGKVLQAAGAIPLPEEPLDRPTDDSIETLQELIRDLERVRRSGWAVARDELEPGLSAVAAPVRDGNRVVAALGVSGPTARIDTEKTVAVLIEEAARLALRLSRSTEVPAGAPLSTKSATSSSREEGAA
jgi:IclR family transcriptional regulator, acetate operon repressor